MIEILKKSSIILLPPFPFPPEGKSCAALSAPPKPGSSPEKAGKELVSEELILFFMFDIHILKSVTVSKITKK